MLYRKNITAGLVLTAFSMFVIWQSFHIRVFVSSGAPPLNSAAVPRMWGGILLLLSLMLLVRGLLQYRVFRKSGKKAPEIKINVVDFFRNHYPVILTFVLLAIYIVLMQIVGFLIMTALYLFAQILVLSPLGRKKYVFSAILSVGMAVLVTYIFTVPFSVLLPRGILGF